MKDYEAAFVFLFPKSCNFATKITLADDIRLDPMEVRGARHTGNGDRLGTQDSLAAYRAPGGDRGGGYHKMEKTLKYKADFVPSTQEQMSFLNLGLFKLKPDTSWSSQR